MRRIAIANQKGGVGKTATSVNLAAAWGEMGQRVLVVDLDPQAQATYGLGAEESKDLFRVFVDGMPLVVNESCATNVGIVPSSGTWLANLERGLAGEAGAEFALQTASEALPSEWDVVVYDCPPSLGFLVMSAFIAAKSVIVAFEPRGEPLRGFSKMWKTLELVQTRYNQDLTLEAFVGMRTNSTRLTKLARDTIGSINRAFPDVPVLTVRNDVKVSEAWSNRVPALLYNLDLRRGENRGANDYRSIARTLEGRA